MSRMAKLPNIATATRRTAGTPDSVLLAHPPSTWRAAYHSRMSSFPIVGRLALGITNHYHSGLAGAETRRPRPARTNLHAHHGHRELPVERATGRQRAMTTPGAGRNRTIAVLLSAIFPGLGQFYNRQPIKGAAFL